MIRRGPTRIALKIDDISEFETFKKELEQQRREKQQLDGTAAEMEGIEGQDGGTPSVVGDSVKDMDPKARQERIQQRIGYDPRPAPSTSSRIGFGELRSGE
ncbi:anaphase-promoting complex subunit CDC26-like [Acanthaster planci]|uniref:Anaphase-promoting complex subunit CDC26 n=1 Tax=Acanthaster planci TaxID=133434 RepID=A0A8B8A148_ACAPL|nr:anaphase-promoting complex subunit CDC26-like [Acanthaster planci]